MAELNYSTMDSPYDDFLQRSGDEGSVGINVGSGGVVGSETIPVESLEQKIISGQSLDNLWINSWIKSKNYKPKSYGFLIDGQAGYIECMQLYVGSGGIVGGKIDIPDTTTASSFHVDVSGNLWIGTNTATGLATAPFSVTSAGVMKAISATIGGWTVNATSIFTGTEDHSGYTTNAGDITIYSNGTDSSIHAKNFYIDTAGSLTCTSATISGGITTTSGSVLDGQYLSAGTIASAAANIALQGWTQTCVFSASDADTVAWGVGVFTTSAGTSYNITASNTGNMSARTYIYLDIAVSTTAYQTTTTAATAIGNGKCLVAVAENGTSVAEFQVFGGIGGIRLNVDDIAANSASTNEFVANTANIANAIITDAKISDLAVSKLTAGSITSKAITLAVSEGTGDSKIQSGKTDFTNTESGFILGIDDSDSNKAKFYIGDSSYYLSWDGSTLDVVGTAKFQSIFTAAEAITANDAVAIREFYKGGSSAGSTDIAAATYVYQDQPTTNYGNINLMYVSKTTAAWRTLLMLDRTLAGDGFALTLTNGGTVNIAGGVPALYLNTSSWSETSVTWDTKPSLGKKLADLTFSNTAEGESNTFTITDLNTTDVANINSYGLTITEGTMVNASSIPLASDDNETTSRRPESNVETGGTSGTWLIQADASNDDFRANQFIGFATAAISADAAGIVQMEGIVSGFTSLTPGSTYYLSDTSGAISTSAGSQSRKVGIAISSTQIFIKHDNP